MAATYSGVITIAAAGTAQQGPGTTGHLFAVKAHPDNTDTVWIGNVSGNVASTNGFALNPGEQIIVEVGSLDVFWFDADVSGEKLCWLVLRP